MYMSKKYEVWGYDTFARENYLCGTYSTRREAQQMMRKMERRVQGQSSSLRDSFSILEVTDEVDEERSLRELELDWQKSADAGYNPDFISRVVDNLLQQSAETVIVTDRNSEATDIVVFDFEGFSNGEKIEHGDAKNYTLDLANSSFIPGFAEQLVGRPLGEDFEINVTFPEEYHEKKLAGQPAVFKCKINEIKTKVLPELNDEFASNVSDFETLEEYKQDIRKHLQESLDQHNKKATENNMIEAVVKNATVEIPNVLVERQLDMFVRDFETRLSYQGMRLEDYLAWSGTKIEDLKEERREQAKETVKTRLVLEALIKKENLTVTEEELDDKIKGLAQRYKKDFEEYKKSLGERQVMYYENELLMNKVINFLTENNKLV